VTILAHVSMQTACKVSSRREAADILFLANGVEGMPAVRFNRRVETICVCREEECVIAGCFGIGAPGNATYN
jgi:hypothetical protein